MQAQPIFFGITRSFWSFVATLALVVGMGEDTIRALAAAAALTVGADPEAWGDLAVLLAPIITMSFTLHQRAGAARPYTARADSETLA